MSRIIIPGLLENAVIMLRLGTKLRENEGTMADILHSVNRRLVIVFTSI